MPKTIDVPKTPEDSFNPDRPASALLQSQAAHLYETLKWHIAELQALLAVNPQRLRTEREVGDYVRQITQVLHPHSRKRVSK
ncbi:MAG TPA: hypothetical protein VHW24_10455 [Bryobacteraceae bacterium]|jgi:hypothetical protein|nr:hypothetical protein [Bryobacteraceae bacterium]